MARVKESGAPDASLRVRSTPPALRCVRPLRLGSIIQACEIVHIKQRTPRTSLMARKTRLPSDHVTCKHCWNDYRAITVLHLRNIHGYDGDHPVNDYKRRFHLQSALCGEAREKISVEKEVFWARRGQHWTPARVLAAIRRLHRSGQSLRRQDVGVRLSKPGGDTSARGRRRSSKRA